MTGESMRSGEVTANVLYIKVWIIQAGIFVGGLLMFLQCIKLVASQAAEAWKNRSQPVYGLLDNPYLVVPFFVSLLALGTWLLTVNGLLGMIILLLAFLFSGVPVFSALAMTGVLGFFMVFNGASNWPMVPVIALRSLNDYTLVALPVFILGAQMLEHSKIGDQMFNLCTKWVGHLPGGLAIATVIACAIFSAISGSSVATAATIGIIAIPAMISRGYNPRLAAGVLAAAGTLGILIPPSGPMIIYSSITDESTGALFMAGVMPGLLLTALFTLYVYLYCRRTGQYQPEERATWRERFIAFKESAWGLMTPVIILGGIYTGLFTPLEAAAVMVIYALIVSIATGSLKPKDIPQVMALSTRNSAMILMIIAGAMIMGTVFTMLQVPQKATEFIATAKIPTWGVIAGIMVLLMIMGMFLDVVSILLITVPILYPIITSLGLNGIWFAVLLVINMEMAVITPPVGLNLYVIKAMTRLSLSDIVRGVFPFFFIIVLLLLLAALYTPLSLWLPSTMK